MVPFSWWVGFTIKSIMDEQDWQKKLTTEQYRVLREKGTETPGSGKYYRTTEPGMYRCVGCGQELFSSETKYDSGSGWPSFFAPVDPEKVELIQDNSHGMSRTEVRCRRCGGHLGHVFDDGPTDKGGQRFCINSVSLELEKTEEGK